MEMTKKIKVNEVIVYMNPIGPTISITLPPISGPVNEPTSNTITSIAVAQATCEALYLSPNIVSEIAKIPLAAPPHIKQLIAII